MTLDRAREIFATQLQFGGGYDRNAVRRLLGEVQRPHGGQPAVDGLIREFDLKTVFGLKPGTDFGRVGRRRRDRGAVTIRPSHLQPQRV